MFIGEKGLNIIKQFEGCILQSYDDYNDKIVNAGESYIGTLTIGYGHIEGVYAGQEITQQQADDLLINDMYKYCDQVNQLINDGIISFPVSQNMFDALVSFDYNLGQGNLRTLCQNRSAEIVTDKMLLYINPGSVWEGGLFKRRTAERALFLSNDSSSGLNIVKPSQPSINNDTLRIQQLMNQFKMRDGKGNVLDEDGIAGTCTREAVKRFQSVVHIGVDGIAGDQTWGAINRILSKPMTTVGNSGYAVRYIQFRVGTEYDGIFGTNTKEAVCQWQAHHSCSPDGIVGNQTWNSLIG